MASARDDGDKTVLLLTSSEDNHNQSSLRSAHTWRPHGWGRGFLREGAFLAPSLRPNTLRMLVCSFRPGSLFSDSTWV